SRVPCASKASTNARIRSVGKAIIFRPCLPQSSPSIVMPSGGAGRVGRRQRFFDLGELRAGVAPDGPLWAALTRVLTQRRRVVASVHVASVTRRQKTMT